VPGGPGTRGMLAVFGVGSRRPADGFLFGFCHHLDVARPIPIPADLWARLAAFDRRCTVGLVRRDFDDVPGHRWLVTIALEHDQLYRSVQAMAPALADALLVAIAKGEAKGWHKPDQGDGIGGWRTSVRSDSQRAGARADNRAELAP
jgi:hypothetical protein